MADGGAAPPWRRPLRGVGGQVRARRGHPGATSRRCGRVEARFRRLERRSAGDARSLRLGRQRLHRDRISADRIWLARDRAGDLAALALDRRHAANRLPDGVGLVEALAGLRLADRRSGRRRQPAFRGRGRRSALRAAGSRERPVSRGARRPSARHCGPARDRPARRRRRWQQQLGARPEPNGDRTSDAGRRSSSPARNAEHVLAGPSCLRRIRRHRPHCAGRPRLSAFRSQRARGVVRDARLCRYP